MLAFFRRIIQSRVGVIVAFAVLLLIALAFGMGDISNLGSGLSGGGGSVATVAGDTIGTAELRNAARTQMEDARRQDPRLDMAQFVAAGGFEATLERLINERAVDRFGRDVGMRVGKKLVDGQLASFPGLQGPDGKFNQQIYEGILRQRRTTDAEVRADIARGIVAQQLMLPTGGATQMPALLAQPYANLLLERRQGEIGLVPVAAVPAGAASTVAELQTWYRRNIARYSLPERRVIRYALVTPAGVKARAAPSEAEVAQSYAQQRQKYAATQKRKITQVTVLDQAAADALAARIKAGASVADAARTAGLEPRTLTGVDKAGYAAQSSPAAADAAFGAAKGAVIGPVRGTIGFVVARIEAVEQVPARTLAQAHDEIVAALTQTKTQAVMSDIQDKLGGAFDGNATFAEAIADQKLQAQATPAVTAQGLNPDQPGARPDPALAPVVQAAFAMADGDAPTIVQTAADGSYAVVAIERVVPAAPRPLAAVRDQVARDIALDRAKRAARQVAAGIVAKAGGGMPLAQAVAAAGLKLPAIRPLEAARADLARDPNGAPPPLALLFSMASGTAKLLEAPNDLGWYVIRLDRIVPGDARRQPQVAVAAQRELAQLLGREYVQQFTTAIRRQIGVKRDAKAIAEVRAALTSNGGSDQ